MRTVILTLLTFGAATCAQAAHAGPQHEASGATTQSISRVGSKQSIAAPTQYFTGRVRIDPMFDANEQINASGGVVTFEPGARSAWHTHPRGQYLVVTAGVGLTQEWGKPIEQIRPGDVVWCPPGIKHWHGAGPTTAVSHLAVSGTLDGKNVQWMEKVTDAQYAAR